MPIPSNFPKYERMSAKDLVLLQLQQWITDGTLQPGEKIVDTELAEALGVSRTPVREALQILAIQGFVEMIPGKETRVTEICPKDVDRLYPPLAELDALTARTVAPTISAERIAQLEEYNEQFAQAVRNKDKAGAIHWDEQFHQAILEEADNPYISSFISTLQLHLRRIKYVFFHSSFVPAETSIEEHKDIIEAFKQRDAERAARLIRQNWLRAREIVSAELKKKEEFK
jgi:DNA-binding GntR family transcriptional regulator